MNKLFTNKSNNNLNKGGAGLNFKSEQSKLLPSLI